MNGALHFATWPANHQQEIVSAYQQLRQSYRKERQDISYRVVIGRFDVNFIGLN